MSQEKKRVAVFFGSRSPEHDVSVVTGLQVLSAIDPELFDAFPVYITPDGKWLVGDVLKKREHYMLDKNLLAQTTEVILDVNVQDHTRRKGILRRRKNRFFGKADIDSFDVAFLAFHGINGEDGTIQGVLELAGIPYTGMRVMASSILMDKVATKKILKALQIPHLPYGTVKRPPEGFFIGQDELDEHLSHLEFPCVVKPCHLGSSIGVAKVKDTHSLNACLPAIFEYDDEAIVEPYVSNLVEYNVAVMRMDNEIRVSAIERPKTQDELLDFKQKYLSGGDNKSGTKNPGAISEGMLSLTRELNPEISEEIRVKIHNWSITVFEALRGSGAPRIDYLCDAKTGKIWLNEVNPFPGSCGYFLWEAAEKPLLFTELLTRLIEEGLQLRLQKSLPQDPVPAAARLFKRPL